VFCHSDEGEIFGEEFLFNAQWPGEDSSFVGMTKTQSLPTIKGEMRILYETVLDDRACFVKQLYDSKYE
jgi:hypothetical protein